MIKAGIERRRSTRHSLGGTAEVHIGPQTFRAQILDVSKHGMGLRLPGNTAVVPGQTIWILAGSLVPYAITGVVVRVINVDPELRIGVEFEEILAGEAMEKLESMPLLPEEHAQPTPGKTIAAKLGSAMALGGPKPRSPSAIPAESALPGHGVASGEGPQAFDVAEPNEAAKAANTIEPSDDPPGGTPAPAT